MESYKKKRHKATLFITRASLIAAAYAALTLLTGSFSFGTVQLRLSEALTVLPYFTFAAVPGLFAGCLIANIFSGSVIDIIVGPLVTLLAALLSYVLRKYKFLVPLPPFVLNTLIIPLVLKYAYMAGQTVYYIMLTVGIGEFVCVYIIGLPLMAMLKKHEARIFDDRARHR